MNATTISTPNKYSFETIKGQVFPYLEAALKKLLDQVNKNQEVNRYQTKLAKKKIYDRCEQKFIEKERLRKQLGEQYESSEDSDEDVDYEFLGINKQNLKKYIRQQLENKNFDMSYIRSPHVTFSEKKISEQPIAEGTPKIDVEVKLGEIKENQEQDQSKLEIDNTFNPLIYLANEMELMYNKKKKQVK